MCVIHINPIILTCGELIGFKELFKVGQWLAMRDSGLLLAPIRLPEFLRVSQTAALKSWPAMSMDRNVVGQHQLCWDEWDEKASPALSDP